MSLPTLLAPEARAQLAFPISCGAGRAYWLYAIGVELDTSVSVKFMS